MEGKLALVSDSLKAEIEGAERGLQVSVLVCVCGIEGAERSADTHPLVHTLAKPPIPWSTH